MVGVSGSSVSIHLGPAVPVALGSISGITVGHQIASSIHKQPIGQVVHVGNGIHSEWTAIYVRTATCDGCETRAHAVLQRCASRGCAVQLCRGCVVANRFNTDTHRLDGRVNWTPPSRGPRRSRGSGQRRGRGS